MPKPVPKPDPRAFIVFGADEHGKPRGAVFTGLERKALEKACEGLNLRLTAVSGDEFTDLAKQLPPGRLHASGKSFVPFIGGDLYCDIVRAAADTQKAPEKNETRRRPSNWEDVKAGDLVITQESHECGWWEAVVVERKGDVATLTYRDFPAFPPFARHRALIAFLGVPSAKPPEQRPG